MKLRPEECIYCAALAILALLAAAGDMHAETRDAQSGAIVTAEIVERARWNAAAQTVMTRPVSAWEADLVLNQAASRLEEKGSDDDTRHARALRVLLTQLRGPVAPQARIDRGDDGRGVYERALDVTRQEGEASVGMLCRALGIDEAAATGVLADLQRTGLVGAANDQGWHKVRVS